MEITEKASVKLYFVGRTSDPDMDVLDDSRFNRNVNRHRLCNITQVTFCKDVICKNRKLKWGRRNLRYKMLETSRNGPEAKHKKGTMMTIIPWKILMRHGFHDGFIGGKQFFQRIE